MSSDKVNIGNTVRYKKKEETDSLSMILATL